MGDFGEGPTGPYEPIVALTCLAAILGIAAHLCGVF